MISFFRSFFRHPKPKVIADGITWITLEFTIHSDTFYKGKVIVPESIKELPRRQRHSYVREAIRQRLKEQGISDKTEHKVPWHHFVNADQHKFNDPQYPYGNDFTILSCIQE